MIRPPGQPHTNGGCGLDDLRFPTGRFSSVKRPLTAQERESEIDAIRVAPARIRSAVEGLSDAQLDTRYREGGWTVRQVVHHVVDSHVNAYIRFRLALTEENPTVRPYQEKLWAELPDAKTLPVAPSSTAYTHAGSPCWRRSSRHSSSAPCITRKTET